VERTGGMDNVEKRKLLTLSGLELQPVGRPARSRSLYRLRYRGSCYKDSFTPMEDTSFSDAISENRALLWYLRFEILDGRSCGSKGRVMFPVGHLTKLSVDRLCMYVCMYVCMYG
jgi:hypothetical protein